MKNDKPTKKGFFGILRESFGKSGGCCGGGETCGVPPKKSAEVQVKEAPKAKESPQPAPK